MCRKCCNPSRRSSSGCGCTRRSLPAPCQTPPEQKPCCSSGGCRGPHEWICREVTSGFRRNPFWPEFAHPRWLSQEELYNVRT